MRVAKRILINGGLDWPLRFFRVGTMVAIGNSITGMRTRRSGFGTEVQKNTAKWMWVYQRQRLVIMDIQYAWRP